MSWLRACATCCMVTTALVALGLAVAIDFLVNGRL